jgi:MFS family permease
MKSTSTARNALSATDLDEFRGRPRRRRSAIRYGVLTVVSLGIAINYIDRSVTSVALPAIHTELHLNAVTEGILLSCFFWTYTLFQIPGGALVDRIGHRKVLGVGGLLWGIATLLSGVGRSLGAMVALRSVMGVAEAPAYSGASSAVKQWFPKRERAFASGTFNVGSKVGGTLAIPLVSVLVGLIGWRGAFAVAGVLAVLWGLTWLLVYRTPRAQRWTSRAEIEHIESDQETLADPGIRLRHLFRFRAIHAMSVGFFCVNFVSYFFFTWFPTYLISTFHLSILKFGFLGMLPGIAAIVGGWVGGLVSDGLYRRGVSVTMSRKIPLVVGMLGSAVIGLAAFSPTVVVSLTCLCIANACSTGAASALWALPVDIAPSPALVGTIGGIQNTAANVAGIVSPILIGVILGYTSSFVVPLLIAGGVGILGAVTYGLWLPKVEPLRS